MSPYSTPRGGACARFYSHAAGLAFHANSPQVRLREKESNISSLCDCLFRSCSYGVRSRVFKQEMVGGARIIIACHLVPGYRARSTIKPTPFRTLSSSGVARAMAVHDSRSTEILDHFTVKLLPALADNYMYLIVDKESREAAIVDPANPEEVCVRACVRACVCVCVYTCWVWKHASRNKRSVISQSWIPISITSFLLVRWCLR